MLQFLSKKYFNIGIVLIIICILPLQFINSFSPFNLLVWQDSAPLAKFSYLILNENILNNTYFNFIVSSFLIAIQLFMLYHTFNKIKRIETYSILITWLYFWLIHLFPAMSNFSPALISSTLISIVIYKLFTHIESNSSSYLFNISMLSGLAFLFWYPSVVILVYILLILFQYNQFTTKRVIIVCTSFIIPLIYLVTYYVIQGKAIDAVLRFSNFHIHAIQFPELNLIQGIILLAILIMIIIGGLNAMAIAAQTIKTSRLFINSMFTLLIVLLTAIFLSNNNIIYSGLLIFIPLSLFLVYYINIFKRPLFAELAHFTLILLIIINYACSF